MCQKKHFLLQSQIPYFIPENYVQSVTGYQGDYYCLLNIQGTIALVGMAVVCTDWHFFRLFSRHGFG